MYSRDCQRPKFLYETIQVSVTVNGSYSLNSDSSVDLYGYVYRNSFDPLKPSENKLIEDDQSGCAVQFKLVLHLQIDTTYILVVTTYHPGVTGALSIVASGPNNVTFKRTSE
jgi:hypothetical protein